MDLIDGDFIISEHSIEETFGLIESALTASNNEHASWQINVDGRAACVSAEATYQKPPMYKRTLLIEINLFDMAETRTRLDVTYALIPHVDIKPAEQFLNETVQRVAQAVNPNGVVYSRSGKLPAELTAVAKQAEGSDSLLKGFELAMVVNIIFFLAGLIPGLGWLSAMFIKPSWLSLCHLW